MAHGKRRSIAGEFLASAARRVAMAPSRLYYWLSVSISFSTLVFQQMLSTGCRLTTQTAGTPYLPLAAAFRMSIALLFCSLGMFKASNGNGNKWKQEASCLSCSEVSLSSSQVCGQVVFDRTPQ